MLGLSPRLTIGAAPWRDPDRVAAAARGWIESSLAAAGQDGHALLVALLGGQVAGLVSLVEREHFTGELDAYIGELVVGQAQEGQGAGRALRPRPSGGRPAVDWPGSPWTPARPTPGPSGYMPGPDSCRRTSGSASRSDPAHRDILPAVYAVCSCWRLPCVLAGLG